MSLIAHNLKLTRTRIIVAANAAGRDLTSIKLLAVSKNFNCSSIIQAIDAEQLEFGENYLQEALHKISFIKNKILHKKIVWHFIGTIQNNKTKKIAQNFDWVHSIDRVKIVNSLNQHRPLHLLPLNVCLQINLEDENKKHGLNPMEIVPLAKIIMQLPRLRLRGLMTILKQTDTQEKQRIAFRTLKKLTIKLKKQGIFCDTLSMGMSHDMITAISEGATIVRIGSMIFGKR